MFLASLALTTQKRGAPCLALDCHVLVASSVLTFAQCRVDGLESRLHIACFNTQGLLRFLAGMYVMHCAESKRIEIGQGSNKDEIHATKE